tara:strand:- start:229 stop:657 length:429 start_codon:yes stop_codon:yes gene_type:complete
LVGLTAMIIYQYLYLMDLYFRKRNREFDDSHGYFSAILTLFLAFILVLYNILAFCGVLDKLLEYRVDSGFAEYLVILVVTILVTWSLTVIFKKEKVLDIVMDKRQKRLGYIFIVLFFLFAFCLLIIQSFKKFTIYDLIEYIV